MSTCIKAAGTVPAGQIVFFRSFFALLPILAVLYYRRELSTAFHTAHPFGHLFRALVGVFSMGPSFYGLPRLPLPGAIRSAGRRVGKECGRTGNLRWSPAT